MSEVKSKKHHLRSSIPLSFPEFVATLRPQMRGHLAMAATEIVRARIDQDTKERASAALAEMGLSVSDAIRLLMFRIADEKRLPFEVKVPNAETRAAMAELEAGKGHRYANSAELLKDVGV